MNHLNKLSKFFLYLTVLSGSLWTGTYLLRMLLTYQIFEGTDLVLREYISPGSLGSVYFVLNPAIASTFTLFILFLFSFIIFLLTSKIRLKQNGWLFIIVVIALVTAPFEIYLMSIDYDILININYETLNEDFISGLLRKRIKVLSSFPLIELFSYFAFYYLILFRPFTVINEN